MATLRDKIREIIEVCNKPVKKKFVIFHETEALDRIMGAIDEEQKVLSPPLRWFAELMEMDLRKNDFKGGWLDGELGYYRGKALEHLIALEDIDSMKFKTIISKKHAIDHCFKSANYAMMLAHNLIEELRKEEEVIR